jgi:uncharacterized protein (TIGR02598 family)
LSGFSLVEVMLALGVLAFTSVGLLGLVASGLGSFREAVDLSTGAQISQRVVGDVQQMDFDTLLAAGVEANADFFVLPERCFDEQGSEVLPAPGAEARIIYRVRVRVARPGARNVVAQSKSGFTSLPGGSGASRFQLRDTVFLTIQIANNPGNRVLERDERLLWTTAAAAQKGCPVVTTSAVVTRSDRQQP